MSTITDYLAAEVSEYLRELGSRGMDADLANRLILDWHAARLNHLYAFAKTFNGGTITGGDLNTRVTDDPAALDAIVDLVLARLQAKMATRV